jgi:hypothetical protein
MAGDSEIIREYLVSLGFKIDAKALSRFEEIIGKTAKTAATFAGTLVGLAVTTSAFVDKVASKMEDLYWASVRLRDGAANIQDFQLTLSKLGGTAEGALNSLENMARYLRTNPAGEGLLHNLGVQTRDANNNLRSTISIVRDFAKLPLPYWLKVKFGERFGIAEKDLQAIIRAAPEAGDKLAGMYKRAGINADKAAKDSKNFENSLADLTGEAGVLAVILETAVLPAARGFIAVAATLGEWLLTLNRLTDGWGTALLVIGVIAGGVALAFGWIPGLIALVAFLAASIIGNWDKVKSYFNSFVEWLRDKYNTVAKYLGLPQWGGKGSSAPQQGGVSGPARDFRREESNLGPSTQFGAPGGAGDSTAGRAIAYFQKAGWSAAQAAGIVANLIAESGLNPRSQGDHGQAYGAAQWHPDRQAAFARLYGHSIQGSSLEEQLAFVNQELTTGGESSAGRLLKGVQNAALAGALVSKYYERPAGGGAEAASRGRSAQALFNGSRLTGGGSSGAKITVDSKTDIKVIGSGNPDQTARAVGREQGRVNGNLVRNFAGAVN